MVIPILSSFNSEKARWFLETIRRQPQTEPSGTANHSCGSRSGVWHAATEQANAICPHPHQKKNIRKLSSLLSVTGEKSTPLLLVSDLPVYVVLPGALLPASPFMDLQNVFTVCYGISFNMASVQGMYFEAREVQHCTLVHGCTSPTMFPTQTAFYVIYLLLNQNAQVQKQGEEVRVSLS